MKFRYDINTLRAIAVLGVLLFHFKIPFSSGGFAGVDVFFVISGYLMSRIIIDGINAQKFTILGFYAKRAQRIIPALLFLILMVMGIGFFLFLPIDYQENAKNSASGLAFVSNIFFWKNSNYFDPSSETNLFLHTWSLSLEWQFYLILPVVLVLLNKFFTSAKKYLVFLSLTTVISVILMIVINKISAKTSFYLLPSRSWELTLGGLAYLMEGKIKGLRARQVGTIISYLVIFVCFVLFNSDMEWPGLFTIIPVVATAFILITNYQEFSLLKNPVVQFIGKISYSLYLWHWPIYVIAQYLGYDTENTLCISVIIVLCFVCAYISYRFIESIKYKTVVPILVTTVVLCLGNVVLFKKQMNRVLFKPRTLAISNYKVNHSADLVTQFSSGCCFLTSSGKGIKDFNKPKCLTVNTGMKNILLLGDSHAAQYSQSLRELLRSKNINILQATASGCMPVIRKNGHAARCTALMSYVFRDFIVNNSTKINGVIICANWIDHHDSDAVLAADLRKTIQYLKDLKINTILIGQNETYKMPYASIAAREYQSNSVLRDKYINVRSTEMNKYMLDQFKGVYIDVYNDRSLPVSKDNIPYMSDLNHFTKYGADFIVSNRIITTPIAENFFK